MMINGCFRLCGVMEVFGDVKIPQVLAFNPWTDGGMEAR